MVRLVIKKKKKNRVVLQFYLLLGGLLCRLMTVQLAEPQVEVQDKVIPKTNEYYDMVYKDLECKKSAEGMVPRLTNVITAKITSLKDEQLLVQTAQALKASPNMYSLNALCMLNSLVELVVFQEFYSNTVNYRLARRGALRNDPVFYTEVVCDEHFETEILFATCFSLLLAYFGEDLQKYKVSLEYWRMVNPQFDTRMHVWYDDFKLKLPSERDRSKITNAIAKKMIRYQLEVYPTITVKGKLKDPALEMVVKKNMLHDLTFLKFGFEDEDQGLLTGLGGDPEYEALVAKLQNLMFLDQKRIFGDKGQVKPRQAPGRC